MARKRRNRGGQRGSKNSARPAVVVSLTPTEAFQAQLARSDACPLKGKFIQAAALTTTPTSLLAISPLNLGVRANGLSAFFTRYRIKYLNVKFTTNTTSLGNAVSALGFIDDVATSTSTPSSVGGVGELRCSATCFGSETVPSRLMWKPSDPNRWYYTQTDGDDPRFEFPAVLYGASSANQNLAMEIDYSIVFSGAADVGSS